MSDIAPPTPPEPPFDIIEQPTFEKGRRYTREQMQPIIEGKVRLPNPKLVDPKEAVRRVALYSPSQWTPGKVKLTPGSRVYTPDAIYILDHSGGGFVITHTGDAFTFALCEHKMVSTLPAGFDPRRGWRPGFCEKCGCDMSTDSSD